MRTGMDQGGIICPVQFNLYVTDMPTHSRHVELVLYTDDTAIIARSSQPALFVNYLVTYISETGRWLGEWRITSVSSAQSCSSLRPVGASRNLGPAGLRAANPLGRYCRGHKFALVDSY